MCCSLLCLHQASTYIFRRKKSNSKKANKNIALATRPVVGNLDSVRPYDRLDHFKKLWWPVEEVPDGLEQRALSHADDVSVGSIPEPSHRTPLLVQFVQEKLETTGFLNVRHIAFLVITGLQRRNALCWVL